MNPISKFRNTYLVPPWIDYHTVEHIMRGTAIAFIGQYLFPFWWVMGLVAFVAVVHEIVQRITRGWEYYGSYGNWQKNTIGDLVFEIGIGALVAL